MTIRTVTAADIPELLALVKDYWNFEDIAGFDPDAIARSGTCWASTCSASSTRA